MAFNTEIPELDDKGLRHFGLMTGAIIAVLFGLILPWVFSASFPKWPWITATVLMTWALVAPGSLRMVYTNWMKLGMLLSLVTTPLVLGIVFYLVFTPVSLVMKLLGKDPMSRSFSDSQPSYRTISKKVGKSQMEKPF